MYTSSPKLASFSHFSAVFPAVQPSWAPVAGRSPSTRVDQSPAPSPTASSHPSSPRSARTSCVTSPPRSAFVPPSSGSELLASCCGTSSSSPAAGSASLSPPPAIAMHLSGKYPPQATTSDSSTTTESHPRSFKFEVAGTLRVPSAGVSRPLSPAASEVPAASGSPFPQSPSVLRPPPSALRPAFPTLPLHQAAGRPS